MRVYQGKLNTNISYVTKDDVITLLTSGGFRQGATAVPTRQWTQSYKGTPNANYSMAGTIINLDGEQIDIFVVDDQYYWFTGSISDDSVVLGMKKDGMEDYGRAELSLIHSKT
ncbi:hypothetical protein N7536_012278 [Penicillium majusculum]|uniref:Uncharacterized protein n=1 Tax=Penicillium solitum TaxID=60172 RepID=A0A1V6Q7E1_9EURO|nr:uncharacterized protein PENSOL_c108G03913 [Penicillium solitum]KAJ5681139.1 hypothetical protein N7536_012278 [Penicillium majusculum]OQD85143.1 hypothetical protein PENSOL_c108G03913 [Penicillium solitum]